VCVILNTDTVLVSGSCSEHVCWGGYMLLAEGKGKWHENDEISAEFSRMTFS